MSRFYALLLVAACFVSCSKDEPGPTPAVVIPDVLDGVITDFNLAPVDINTPDRANFLISVNNTVYRVELNAVAQSAANATIVFDTDTILNNQSREFANLGKDVVSYNPVASNRVFVFFKDGRKVTGTFTGNTNFGGEFGETIISQWRTAGDPAKPNQKAAADLINLIRRYRDTDGPGPGAPPLPLMASVSKS